MTSAPDQTSRALKSQILPGFCRACPVWDEKLGHCPAGVPTGNGDYCALTMKTLRAHQALRR